MQRHAWNAARLDLEAASARQGAGHYESWFQRANHPTRPQAFWIRYTVFVPGGRPDLAIGELWAVYFDGDTGSVLATKQEYPLAGCTFSRAKLDVQIGQASLTQRSLCGRAADAKRSVEWELEYESPERPLLLLPERVYGLKFPAAKSMVGSPMARYSGSLSIDSHRVAVDGWVGSQNHNWGTKHTDEYAWGQVAGFDDAPDAFLELSTARVRTSPLSIGPLRVGSRRLPWLTLLVLRVDGEELRLNSPGCALRARASYMPFRWNFSTRQRGVSVVGSISAPRSSFIALPYRNPPGGTKTCLNSKLASCELTLQRPGKPDRRLSTSQRGAFEMLTDPAAIQGATADANPGFDHGVPLLEVHDGRGSFGRGVFA